MNYYFLGIGGIGMSAIARFLHQRGDSVSGYDRTPSPLTRQLEQEGIPVHYDDDPSLIPSHIDLVIYTPAVPTDTAEYQHLLALGLPIKKRSQVLGELTRGKHCIAVAGTHGKTSTSTLIAHLLSQTELGCSAFLGGISKNFGSNLLVNNGTVIAAWLGVPDSVIGLTMIALGTSLPELITAITSLIKGHGSLSLGNIIGANLFNIVLVSGMAITISPFRVPTEKTIGSMNASLVVDIPIAFLVMSILCVPTLLKEKISRWQGILLLGIYAAFLVFQFLL